MTAEEAKRKVLARWPGAYINSDYSGSPSADVAVFRRCDCTCCVHKSEIQLGRFKADEALAWIDAANRLTE